MIWSNSYVCTHLSALWSFCADKKALGSLFLNELCLSSISVVLSVGLHGTGGRGVGKEWGQEKLTSFVFSVLRPPRNHVLLEQNCILKAQHPQPYHEAFFETAFTHLLLHSPCATGDLKLSLYLSHIALAPQKTRHTNITHFLSLLLLSKCLLDEVKPLFCCVRNPWS